MTRKLIHFIRHGESTGNLIRQLQSVVDTDLTQRGYEQARELRGVIDVTTVYSSPLKRAYETALTAFGETADIITMKDLHEIDLGILAGKCYPDLSDGEKRNFSKLSKDRDFALEDGESLNQLRERILRVLNEIVKDMDSRNITSSAIITHGGVLKEFLTDYLQQENINFGNCSVFYIAYEHNQWNFSSPTNGSACGITRPSCLKIFPCMC